MKKLILFTLLLYPFLTFSRKENKVLDTNYKMGKPISFDIIEYFKKKYPGNSYTSRSIVKDEIHQNGKIKTILTSKANYSYYEVFDEEGNILGYNILGAGILKMTTYNGERQDGIIDPHFIDRDGNYVISNKFLLRTLNKNNTLAVFTTPSVTFRFDDGESYQDFIYNIDSTFEVFTCNEKFNNLKMIFSLDNINREENNRLQDVRLLKSLNGIANENYFVLENGIFDRGSRENRLGLMNRDGNILFDNQFTDIQLIEQKKGVDYFLVQNYKSQFGIANAKGAMLYDTKFDELNIPDSTNNGLAKVKYSGYYGLINRDLEIVVEPKYEDIQILNGHSAIIKHQYSYKSSARFDFFDLSSKKELGLQLQELGNINNPELIAVKINNRWGFASPSGKIVIAPSYSFVSHFNEGLALVFKNSQSATISNYGANNSLNNSAYVINKSGIVLSTLSQELSNDISVVDVFSEGLLQFMSKSKKAYGFINSKGIVVIPPVYENATSFFNGIAAVTRYGTNFKIDKNGKRID